tara:strand:+ start:559 stop:1695 length:1137 start_codon:yes stop_codon:yes gene_type:complete
LKNNEVFLYKTIEDKTIVWSSSSNQYVIVENQTAEIIKRLSKGDPTALVSRELAAKLSLPISNAIELVTKIQQTFLNPKKSKNLAPTKELTNSSIPKNYLVEKYYKINNTVIKAAYKGLKECFLVHPKFEHLQVPPTKYDSCFEVFIKDDAIFLFVNSQFINTWESQDVHYFQGKFSMELIQQIHKKQEEQWMGVFHASAVSDTQNALLFLGDSGNGKSTSLALLQTHGFTCIADDFVPVALQNQEIYSFPAAISIKKSSLETLLPYYPELNKATEYDFKTTQKIVRYVKPNNSDYTTHLPCKGLVFIKYLENAPTTCAEISKIDAFERLVPDSWISPKKENAHAFLNWFDHLACYQLTYSNTKQMVAEVSKLFKDEL